MAARIPSASSDFSRSTDGRSIRRVRTRRRVLSAVAAILSKNGYRGLTIEGVSAKSGVAKTTIYRWWHTKASLCVELYLDIAMRELADPNTGDIATDLRRITAAAIRLQTRTVAGPAFIGLLTEMQLNPEAAGPILAVFAEQRRRLTRQVLARAIRQGQLRPDTDVDLVIDMIGGAATFRLLQRHAPLDTRFVDATVAMVLDGCRNEKTET